MPNWENTCEEASTLGDEGQCKTEREKSATLGENILLAAAAREAEDAAPAAGKDAEYAAAASPQSGYREEDIDKF